MQEYKIIAVIEQQVYTGTEEILIPYADAQKNSLTTGSKTETS